MTHLLREDRLPLPFCPGCAGHVVARQLDRALELLGLGRLDICLVTDIGCNGLMDQYFDTLAFHGLHGRSLTYGTGIKLGAPRLKVLVIMGDGGTGIGGGHLLSAARRDVDITLLVMNNFNYGMTGGQHSATTPLGGFTSTTAQGNVEKPLDICGAVLSAGGRFAARFGASDKDLPEAIARAVRFEGFSVLDVVGPCPAYFMPRNRMKRSAELRSLCEEHGWEFGVLREEPGDDFLRRYRSAAPAAARTPTGEKPGSAGRLGIGKRTEVVLAASAGNRVRFAGAALASSVIRAGGWAVQKDDYPITVRSGYSVTSMAFDSKPIEYIGIDRPDVVAVASPDGLTKTAPLLRTLGPDARVFADEELGEIDTPAVLTRHPLKKTAAAVDRNLVALVSAVLVTLRTGIVPVEMLREAVTHRGRPGVREANRAAVDLAIQTFSS
jgi:pyruvate/2-oxoacid:ferredoxin oxidoreductase beta subunit/Pyruvate/2-oxoacid:ferredoxin oxidoreductase gamma subunit